MRKLVLFVVLGLASFVSQAQAPVKVGYADVDYIFSQLPEAKQIDQELKSLQTQLKNQMDTKTQEFQKKVADYQANINTMIDAVRANTERELQQLQQNLEKFQQDAQTTIQTKQTQLMDPVYKKVGKGIEDVAKENGYSFVLNQQIGGLDVILYGDEKMDISDLVLKKLGVTPKPAAAAPATTPPATTPKKPN
ncbi:OmpH family outer membrane protein [Chryseolinea lacunae]|uniref:OmpH family outer membrane protein n=1 Tax=Chryseolinea lacunae TaxID=2801331 RepID=A0ABS1KR50_9BACT|nr:OmpH family outer membrane protein [Chryseolinea lacunae]MBL0741788.1 OmpH family outer membrane protein [Chryseolinea lacunae]